MVTMQDTFRERMPLHGFATDDLRNGLRKYAATEAIRLALLQFNAKHSIGWLAFDIDHEQAALEWEDRHAPAPNLIIINRDNGHAHYLYGLTAPVHNYNEARPKPQRYLAAIDVALTDKLGADPGYSKLICKNPLHDRWLTITPRLRLYDLDELADYVDLSKRLDARKRLPAIGLGRNCSLFETLRRWAYRQRREPWLAESMFHDAVMCQGYVINAGFNTPLPHSEVRSTAKSVARWTWRKMSDEGFKARQAILSRKAVQAHMAKAHERRDAILAAIDQCPTLTQEDIAALCGVTRRTVCNHLKAARHNVK